LNKNNTNWVNIPNETNSTLNITINNAVPGVYQYRLSVGEGQNINSPSCFVSSSPLSINVNPLPDPGILAVTAACEGQPLVLSATAGADSYEWSGPNGFSSTSQNATVSQSTTVNNAGQYTLKVTTKGCPAFGATNVVIYPAIVPGISPNVAVCAGESAQLSATGGVNYKWTPSTGLDHDDIANPVANPAVTTTYRVFISNQGCTDSSKAVTVTVNNNPMANAGSSQTTFEGSSVQLKGTIAGDNITSYYWSPPDFLDNPNSLTAIATPKHDITYTLHVLTATCGEAVSSVFIRVYEKVTVPNTFTPNGDGINDYWNIQKLSTYPDCLLTIYSRDGQQVYKSVGYSKPWDGTYKNSPVPNGTYYYIIDLNDGQPKLSGWVLVMR
jgi:gliding motility-associated-like protein